MDKLYLLIHLIGYGILFCFLLSTMILEYYVRRAEDYKEANFLILLVSRIGYLAPVGALILLISGILMMNYHGHGALSSGGLAAKIVIFAVMIVTGIYSGINAGKNRRAILNDLIDEKEDPSLQGKLIQAHNKQSQYIRIQSFFLLMVLFFSIFYKS